MSGRRPSFHFPKKATAQLYAIMKYSYLDTGADVIRAALHAYDDMLYLDSMDCKIFVVDKDHNETLYSPYSTFNYPAIRNDPMLRLNELEACDEVPRSFFFSGEAVEQLESIKAKSFMKSNADAIRVALTAYSELLAVDAAGDQIIARDREGREIVYSPHRPLVRDMEWSMPSNAKQVEGVKQRTVEHI